MWSLFDTYFQSSKLKWSHLMIVQHLLYCAPVLSPRERSLPGKIPVDKLASSTMSTLLCVPATALTSGLTWLSLTCQICQSLLRLGKSFPIIGNKICFLGISFLAMSSESCACHTISESARGSQLSLSQLPVPLVWQITLGSSFLQTYQVTTNILV